MKRSQAKNSDFESKVELPRAVRYRHPHSGWKFQCRCSGGRKGLSRSYQYDAASSVLEPVAKYSATASAINPETYAIAALGSSVRTNSLSTATPLSRLIKVTQRKHGEMPGITSGPISI